MIIFKSPPIMRIGRFYVKSAPPELLSTNLLYSLFCDIEFITALKSAYQNAVQSF